MEHKKSFTHNGRNLEVIASLFGETWQIALFENGRKLVDNCADVSEENRKDAESVGSLLNLLDDTIDEVIRMIIDGRAELPPPIKN